ncbi:hypothetical protein DSO57_1013334 [Entomophthora muscae]|uniref:Uncharacterized protein n=1 Tax=Entomophthora muscae TaxID=34485 RepID=A0ACC2UQJ6_9FUNG|nr:hypothetical protein DSO57_1013334 [Entomophthora muscae]
MCSLNKLVTLLALGLLAVNAAPVASFDATDITSCHSGDSCSVRGRVGIPKRDNINNSGRNEETGYYEEGTHETINGDNNNRREENSNDESESGLEGRFSKHSRREKHNSEQEGSFKERFSNNGNQNIGREEGRFEERFSNNGNQNSGRDKSNYDESESDLEGRFSKHGRRENHNSEREGSFKERFSSHGRKGNQNSEREEDGIEDRETGLDGRFSKHGRNGNRNSGREEVRYDKKDGSHGHEDTEIELNPGFQGINSNRGKINIPFLPNKSGKHGIIPFLPRFTGPGGIAPFIPRFTGSDGIISRLRHKSGGNTDAPQYSVSSSI